MNNIIIQYISEQLVNGQLEETLESHDDLLGTGILDSLGMMKLIMYVENEFNIKVAPEDMIIDNFMTVEHIGDYIERTQDTD